MFGIRARNGAGETIARSQASTHDEAAQRYARRRYGREASAVRVTGTPGLSGVYQAYRPARGGGLTSTGDPFHVS